MGNSLHDTAIRLCERENEMKTVNVKLMASEEKYRELVGTAEDAIISINNEGKIILFNESAEKLFGYKNSEVMGKNITSLMPEEFRDSHIKGLKRFLKTEKTKIKGKPMEIEGLTKQGNRFPIELSITPIKSQGEYTFTGIMRDIRKRKKYEEGIKKKNEELQRAYDDLKQAQSQLLQAEKMASIGQLAAGVAHEINNPIGFINSNLSVLSGYMQDIKNLIEKYEELRPLRQAQGDSNVPEEIKNQEKTWQELDDLAQKIDLGFLLNDLDNIISESQEGTERVKKIVKDLKDFSHIDESELKHADIIKGLESTLNIIWNEIKYKAEVIKDYEDIPEILCYPMQLNQVFMNMLVNAAQAIEKKGKIKIATRDLKNDTIEIRISDTGNGISKENIEKIFDPFFTTKEVGKGTGLGLSIAYGIIKDHRGSIEVESQIGEGSTFIITLPVKKE